MLLARVVSGLFLLRLNNNMELEKESKENKHGGARSGAGRPKGSTGKITAQNLLDAATKIIGKPFEVSLLEGYRDSILNDDRRNRVIYEKMLLDKVSSTLVEAEVTTETAAEAKQQAFQEALAKLQALADKAK